MSNKWKVVSSKKNSSKTECDKARADTIAAEQKAIQSDSKKADTVVEKVAGEKMEEKANANEKNSFDPQLFEKCKTYIDTYLFNVAQIEQQEFSFYHPPYYYNRGRGYGGYRRGRGRGFWQGPTYDRNEWNSAPAFTPRPSYSAVLTNSAAPLNSATSLQQNATNASQEHAFQPNYASVPQQNYVGAPQPPTAKADYASTPQLNVASAPQQQIPTLPTQNPLNPVLSAPPNIYVPPPIVPQTYTPAGVPQTYTPAPQATPSMQYMQPQQNYPAPAPGYYNPYVAQPAHYAPHYNQ